MCADGKIKVESLVVDQADDEDAQTRWARRRAIIEAQARLFDEAVVPSARTPEPERAAA